MEAVVFAPPPDRHPGTASGGGGGGRRCCTGEDGREWRELDIQGRGCNEEENSEPLGLLEEREYVPETT
ncbi:hypothetical protein OsI_16389 [Oryza sativa Indica Group]|uniref:Uncharacterized protein n=2 Tax=Oryza sativa TaxID=4530 RepID=B9FFU0_ORYSJ|nr:hypothetical protein OsI_16389 [Oryza sativa Indica Group]EEE61224.1 hypothetical protein OsJ_15257 [Oryza sativa Japonica Group]